MSRKNKYYLDVEGYIIEDLNSVFSVNLEDYLNLSIFTSLFRDDKELIGVLRRLGFSLDTIYDGIIQIRKKIDSETEKEEYKPVTSAILYKSGALFLSEKIIRDFFFANKNNYEAMSTFFENYLAEFDNLIRALIFKTSGFRNVGGVLTESERNKKVEKRDRTLARLRAIKDKIGMILNYIERRKAGILSWEEEKEFINMLDSFVCAETTYGENANLTRNYRGIVRLASNIARLIETCEGLIIPDRPMPFSSTRSRLLSELKKALNKRASFETAIAPEDSNDEIDPDSFAFYTNEDFENLYLDRENPEKQRTQEQLDSIEDDIAALAEKKKRYGI